MVIRAAELGDPGESAPENWEKPFGTPDIHVVLTAVAPDPERLEAILARGRKAYAQLPGIKALWRQDCYTLPMGKQHFGYNDGIGQPDMEGSGLPLSNPKMPPIKAGEFVLGCSDEMGNNIHPKPDVLGRNGSYTISRRETQGTGRTSPGVLPKSERGRRLRRADNN